MNGYYGCGSMECVFGPPGDTMGTLSSCECVKTMSNAVRCARTKMGIKDLRSDVQAIRLVLESWAAGMGTIAQLVPGLHFTPEDPRMWASMLVMVVNHELAQLRCELYIAHADKLGLPWVAWDDVPKYVGPDVLDEPVEDLERQVSELDGYHNPELPR